MLYHNDRCDGCDQVKPTLIGLGPDGTDVLGMCLECLNVMSVAQYQWQQQQWERRQQLWRGTPFVLCSWEDIPILADWLEERDDERSLDARVLIAERQAIIAGSE